MIDEIEAVDPAPESLRERVAEAIYEAAFDGNWKVTPYREHHLRLADAAIAVMRGDA